MAQLHIPNLLILDLNANLDDTTPFDISDLVPRYLTTTLGAHKLTSMTFLGGTAHYCVNPSNETGASYSWRLGMSQPDGDKSAEVRGIFTCTGVLFPLSSLATLIVGFDGLRSNDWTSTLVHFPALTKLYVLHSDLEVIHALNRQVSETDVLCPRLSFLSLRGVDGDASRVTAEIAAGFAARSERGYPLRTLELCGQETQSRTSIWNSFVCISRTLVYLSETIPLARRYSLHVL